MRNTAQAAYDVTVKLAAHLTAETIARIFLFAAATLAVLSAILAVPSLLAGDFAQGLLLVGVTVFAGWMATAIHQFQLRLAGIDEVVRQGKRRVEQSEAALEEMRRLAKSIRATSAADESEEDRTVH